MADNGDHKTIRFVIFSILFLFLGLFYFLFKIEACKDDAPTCKDSFNEFQDSSTDYIKCDPGATVEVVVEPKRGVVCHCPRTGPSAAPSAAE